MMWLALVAMAMVPLTVISVSADEAPKVDSMEMMGHTNTVLDMYDQTRQEVARQMLENAIAAFALNQEWAIEQIHDPDNPLYHDGELYVFVIDASNIEIAHGATPSLAGTDKYTLIDSEGTNLGELFMENRTPYGKWVEYWWPNPATESDKSERKLTWIKTYGGYQFGVGMYPDTADAVDMSDLDKQTMRIIYEMTDAAITAFAADMDSAVAAIGDVNNPLYHDGDLYVFVMDDSGTMVVNGATPDLAGTDIKGTNIGDLFDANKSPYGRWVEYWWPNPATDSPDRELKLTWIKTHAGYTFGVGTYPTANPNPSPALSAYDEERQETAWQITHNVAEAFRADKTTAMAAIQDVSNPLYHDLDIYSTVLDREGTILAHGNMPDQVGINFHNLTDARGTNMGQLLTENHSPYGKWVEYWWPNPSTETQEPERKLALLLDRGGYVFVTGMYPSADGMSSLDAANSDKQRIAKAMVDRAIAAFAADMDSAVAAIGDVNNPLYHDGELYVFVMDDSGTMVVNGATPDLAGTDVHTLIDIKGTNIGDLFDANKSPYGRWVEYWWPNPATDSPDSELKLTWIKTHAGYTFGVGVYP